MPLKIILVPPYIVAVFPLPCPFWLVWYENQSKNVRTTVQIAAALWVALTVVCLVMFGKR